jgi:hypothetical protein
VYLRNRRLAQRRVSSCVLGILHGAVRKQHAYRALVAMPSGAGKCRAATQVAAVDVCAARKQRLDDALVARLAGPLQRREAFAINEVKLCARRK